MTLLDHTHSSDIVCNRIDSNTNDPMMIIIDDDDRSMVACQLTPSSSPHHHQQHQQHQMMNDKKHVESFSSSSMHRSHRKSQSLLSSSSSSSSWFESISCRSPKRNIESVVLDTKYKLQHKRSRTNIQDDFISIQTKTNEKVSST